MDFAQLTRKAAQQHQASLAVCERERELTYEQLFARACRLANALAARGVRKGDRVALLGPNGLETVEQAAGIALGGFVRAGLYTHQTAELNAYMLRLVDATALIVHAQFVEELEPHFAELPALKVVVVLHGESHEHEDYEQLLAASHPGDPAIVLAADAPHVVRFSAGTTGRPKGIVHSNAAWMGVENEWRLTVPRLTGADSYLASGPLTHLAIIAMWPMLSAGGRIVVMDSFDAGRALELIERERITFAVMVPTMIQALLDHPTSEQRDLSSLRCLNYAASPVSERTATRAIRRFGPVLMQMYAQSEVVPATMLLGHEHLPEGTDRERRWLRSVGRPTPNTTVRVVDEDGRSLPSGEVGELAVNGPGRMTAIWKDPEATAARLLEDGSVLTRDMGWMDDEGFVYLTDRKEDMIISGGYNIWPAELEHAIESLDGVAEVCVVGVPHERWGETPKAVVVLEEGSSLSEADVIAHCREVVGSTKKVTSVDFVDALPRSGVGKVLRREVKATHWSGREVGVSGA